jgi:hypothetical protein
MFTTDQKLSFINQELLNVCPFAPKDEPHFIIQIRSFSGRKTKHINITPEQFKKIERILEGLPC